MIGVALTSRSLDPAALRQLANLKIRPALIAVPGVAGVDVLGGDPREFAVDVDPGRLQAIGLSLADVVSAVARSNTVRGVGRLEDRHRLYLVLVENRAATIADITRVPLKAGSGTAAVVTLGQVAVVRPAIAPSFTRVTSDGQNAVLVNVRQALNGNSVAIAKAVDARLKRSVSRRLCGLHPITINQNSSLVRRRRCRSRSCSGRCWQARSCSCSFAPRV